MAKDPLISAADRSPFGAAQDTSGFFETGQDVTYVGGYSNVRRENAQRLARGEKQLPVKYRLHWARAMTPAGKPDGQDLASHRARGYDFVTKDNIASLGFDAPASGQLDPTTGRYTCGDTVLMYCTREVAARNENVLRRATEDRSTADATGSALAQEGAKVGQSLGQDMLTESTVKQEVLNRAVK